MANGKKSFMFYCDWQETFNALPNDKAGELVKHILAYVNHENPETDDLLINAVFANIKNQLKRDLKKWEGKAEQSRINGALGGRPRKPKKPSGLNNNPDEPKKPVIDTVTVKDKVIVNDINKRKVQFRIATSHFLQDYDKDLLEEFYNYWTEHNENGKKMRFEYSKNQPFNIKRRLATWLKNQKKFEKEKNLAPKKENAGQLLRKEMGL